MNDILQKKPKTPTCKDLKVVLACHVCHESPCRVCGRTNSPEVLENNKEKEYGNCQECKRTVEVTRRDPDTNESYTVHVPINNIRGGCTTGGISNEASDCLTYDPQTDSWKTEPYRARLKLNKKSRGK